MKPEPPPGAGPDDERAPDDERGPIGIFPTWRALYGTVLVYWAVLVAVLYIFSVTLDAGAP